MSKWIYPENSAEPAGIPQGVPVTIAEILNRRGIRGEEAIADFLSPKPKTTYDPFLLKDLREGAELIISHAEKGSRICVYGDYDADGLTSTALMLCVLKKLTTNLCYRIPSRFSDGYGLNSAAIKSLADDGVDLIITVDCGSTSPDEVDFAKEIGMDIMVTDHHSPSEGMDPDCLFINPKRKDSGYPFSGLSGCGVAFKLAQGIQRILNERGDTRFTRKDLGDLLDLVAISTIADVVPLLDENRSLVKYGLDALNNTTRPGLRALISALELEGRISADNIAYIIAPHINALGRVSSADRGVILLSASGEDGVDLGALALEMIEANRLRKAEQEKTAVLCAKVMETEDCGDLFPVIYARGIHEGVAGIVAGNLKESLRRPVFVVTDKGDGQLKGTGRCISGLDLHGILSGCAGLFSRYGGHAGACGFSMKEENLAEFRRTMQRVVEDKLREDPELFDETLYIEKELSAAEKSLDFAGELEALEPYGEANPRPLFSISKAEVSAVGFMGQDSRHVRFNVCGSDGIPVNCVFFKKAAEYSDLLTDGSVVDVAGELCINRYGGRSRIQMIVSDVRRSV